MRKRGVNRSVHAVLVVPPSADGTFFENSCTPRASFPLRAVQKELRAVFEKTTRAAAGKANAAAI